MRVGARWLRVRQGRSLIKDMGAAAAPAAAGRGGAERGGPARGAESPCEYSDSLATSHVFFPADRGLCHLSTQLRRALGRECFKKQTKQPKSRKYS